MGNLYCRMCGRRLTNPASIAQGIGPVCAAKKSMGPGLFDDQPKTHIERGPFTGDIRIGRTDDKRPVVNVRQIETYHSPDGFEFGFSGSGPADLALNILLRFTDRETAHALHQDFKAQYVATLPYEGGVIPEKTIRSYLNKNGAAEIYA